MPENITACIAGGVLCGIGAGITLLSKGSGGGEEILGLLLMQKYKSMSVGKIFNIINVFVFTTCMYIYDISSGVYSIFFAVVTAVVIDRVHLQNITMTMLIISKKEQLEDLIFKAVHRGVTKIKGIGAYSGEETKATLSTENIYVTPIDLPATVDFEYKSMLGFFLAVEMWFVSYSQYCAEQIE